MQRVQYFAEEVGGNGFFYFASISVDCQQHLLMIYQEHDMILRSLFQPINVNN